MRVTVDWSRLKESVVAATIFAAWAALLSAHPANQDRFGIGVDGLLLATAVFMLILLWPVFRDLAKAVIAVMMVKAEDRRLRQIGCAGSRDHALPAP